MNNRDAQESLTPDQLVQGILETSLALQIAWRKPKTPEVIAELEDLGLRFRLLTAAFDAGPKGGEQ